MARGISGYYGVGWNKYVNKWCVRIKINGKDRTFGFFVTALEAAKRYDEVAPLYYKFPKLNFPIEPFNPFPNTRLIQLTLGMWAVVDSEDYERVREHEWSAWESNGNWYASTKIKTDSGYKFTLLHRFILGITDPNILIDHKDNDGLHDFKTNIRICTNEQNAMNRKKRKGCTSDFKGVSWYNITNRWKASICFKGHTISLGYFLTEIEAASAYNKKAVEFFGEFCKLNKDEKGNIL